jgi:hypothetical protein
VSEAAIYAFILWPSTPFFGRFFAAFWYVFYQMAPVFA